MKVKTLSDMRLKEIMREIGKYPMACSSTHLKDVFALAGPLDELYKSMGKEKAFAYGQEDGNVAYSTVKSFVNVRRVFFDRPLFHRTGWSILSLLAGRSDKCKLAIEKAEEKLIEDIGFVITQDWVKGQLRNDEETEGLDEISQEEEAELDSIADAHCRRLAKKELRKKDKIIKRLRKQLADSDAYVLSLLAEKHIVKKFIKAY